MNTKRLNSQSEVQFRMMADAVPGLIWTSTADHLCDFFNAGWLTFTGRSLEQEVGNGWTSGIHPEDLERCLQIYHTGHQLEKEFKIEYRLWRHDGQYRWILDTAVPKYDENGKFTGFIGSCADIDELLESERHQKDFISAEAHQREQQLNEELAAANEEMSASNEELTATVEELQQTKNSLALLNEQLEARVNERIDALASSEHNLRSLVMTAHYPLMILRGEDWIIETANQPLVNLWDKSLDDVIGKPLMEILPEIADQPFPVHLRNVYQTGQAFGEEEQIFHYQSPSGPAVKYVSYYYDPLLDRQGHVSGIIVAADDITEKVKARNLLEKSYQEQQSLNEEFIAINEELADTIEQLSVSNAELANSEERFRNLIRQAPVGICVIRASDLMILELNEGYLELVGKQRAELENHTIWDAVAEAAENYAPIMQEVITTGIAFVANEHELILIRNGVEERVFVDFVYEPIKNPQNQVTGIMVLGIEVTDKVIARRNIEDVEERIRLAVEAAEIGTFEHNYHDNKMVTSERFNAIFGVAETSSRDLLFKMIHPEDRHLSASAHIAARNTGKMFYEARIIHHDGSLHWIRVQANAYFDEHGEPYKLLGTLLDITTFKYLQQQKDDFISIASHELKTPITSLKASLQLLDRLKEKPSAAILPRLIEQSSRSMEKISSLVEDLLNVSRMNEGQIRLERTSFNISKLMDDCCSHIRSAGVYQLIFEGDRNLEVFADEDRIEQVLVNFVNNAVKYAPNSHEIFLIVEKTDTDVKVSVRDRGPGITPEKLPYLFDRYYRADDSGYQVSGLGLGLYISAEIIQRHGGKIGVESEAGAGTTFWFTLPLNTVQD